MPPEIERLAHEVLASPVSIDVGRRATPVDAVIDLSQAFTPPFHLATRGDLIAE